LQNKIQPEYDKITERKLRYVQAAITGHVIKCHKIGRPTILKLFQLRCFKCMETMNSMGQDIWANL